MALAGVLINLILMVLNLLPLPPLDGGRVLNGLLPEAAARRMDQLEPYGLVILIVLLATGVLGKLLFWPLSLSQSFLYTLLGLQ
jgi:Zn-dependent protease